MYVWYHGMYACPKLVALCVHNVHAPIVIELVQPFVIEVLGSSKWIVGAWLISACGKYLQLSMYGASHHLRT